jgi:transcriptional regulator with XRE-family HTH domain
MSTRDAIPGFPARLRQLRLATGLTIDTLAALAGTHRDSVAKLERGDRYPSLRLAAALAGALGCKVDDLLAPPGKNGKKT